MMLMFSTSYKYGPILLKILGCMIELNDFIFTRISPLPRSVSVTRCSGQLVIDL